MSQPPAKSVPPAKGQLATSESLQQLDQRHEEILVKLDDLYRELETALANLLPKQEATPLKDAA
jgi:hypothetical protein